MRSLCALALAVLLVSAGCGGFGEPPDGPSTVAPGLRGTPTPTDESPTASTAPPLPPGVTPGADDEVDERTLVVAHERALENRSVTWRSRRVYTNAVGTVLWWGSQTVWTSGSRQRYEAEDGGVNPAIAPGAGIEIDYWSSGTVTVWRRTLANGSVSRSVFGGGPPGSFATVGAGRVFLESLLVVANLQYVGVERRNGTALHVLAGTAYGDQHSRLTVRVSPDGVIRSLVFRTRSRIGGTWVTDVRRFRVYDVGSTTVQRPEWAENFTEEWAENATDR